MAGNTIIGVPEYCHTLLPKAMSNDIMMGDNSPHTNQSDGFLHGRDSPPGAGAYNGLKADVYSLGRTLQTAVQEPELNTAHGDGA